MRSKFITDPLDPSDGHFNPAEPEVFTTFLPAGGHGGSAGGIPQLGLPVPTADLPFESVQGASTTNGSGGPGSVVAETSGGITFDLIFDAAAMANTAAAASFRAGIEQAASILSGTISDPITVTLDINYSGTGGGASAGPAGGEYENYTTVRADLINAATPGDPTFNALPTGSTVQGQSLVAVWDAQLKLLGMALPSDYTGVDGTANFTTDIDPSLLVGVALHELTHALGRVPYGPPEGPEPDIFDLFRFASPGTQLIDGNSTTAPPAYYSIDGGITKLADFGQTSDPSDFLDSGVQGPNDPFNEFYGPNSLQNLTAVDKQLMDALGFHLTPPPVTTMIESSGATSLVEIVNDFFMYAKGTTNGAELQYDGAPLTAGEWGSWTPIGAEITGTGYEVAFKFAGADLYTVWNTDANGNIATDTIGEVPGTSIALEALEPGFHQDLNGDGAIGVVVGSSSSGSTSLVQVGSNYFLESNSTGTGPEVMFGGAPLVAGEFAWTPIAGQQTSTGYEIALKDAAIGQYTVWNVDANGNVTYDPIGSVAGNSAALEAAELSFHQDLNGDGVIGLPGTIESFGFTSLVQAGNHYFLDSNSSGTGPEVMFGGAPLTVGEFPWTPIAGEQTSTGYEIALKDAATGQYTVLNTDTNGNVTYDPIGSVSGSSATLEALEPSFHQDLNGDGVIGIPSGTSPGASGAAPQAAMVAAMNNDTFVFGRGAGAGGAASPPLGDLMKGDGLFSAAGVQPPAALHDPPIGQSPLALLEPTRDGHEIHDSASAIDLHWIDAHASGFLIR